MDSSLPYMDCLRDCDDSTLVQIAAAVAQEQARRLSLTGTRLEAACQPLTTQLPVRAEQLLKAVGHQLRVQAEPDHIPWPRPVCTLPALPPVGLSFPGYPHPVEVEHG